MLNINQLDLNEILGELDSAIHFHGEWFDSVSEVLVCRTQPNPKDLLPDSHRCCPFGGWYYNQPHERLREHPCFQAIESYHTKMHEKAASLLSDISSGQEIKSGAYREFAASVNALKEQISTLSNELTALARNIDPLTGLLNRRGMLSRLREDQEFVKRGIHSISLVMIDLDDFKQINDNYGHQVGDRLLRKLGAFLIAKTRAYDHVYRYGGEEFLVVMRNTEIAEALQLSHRLCAKLREIEIAVDNDTKITVSASMGIAEIEKSISVDDAIHRADVALYKAKREGKNRSCSWQPHLSDQEASPQ